MGFPTPDKTWQFNVNVTLATSSSASVHGQRCVNKIVKMLKSVAISPWVAVQSSNCGSSGTGVANDVAHGGGGDVGSGDRWTVDSNTITSVGSAITVDNDVNFGNAGTRHSWIVLSQAGLGGLQMCIDCCSTSSGSGTIVLSPGGLFTGGTTTNRPTATDEFVVRGENTLLISSVNTQTVFHYTQSTDGQCSRLWAFKSGTTNHFFLMIDKAKNPVSGWTNPIYAFHFSDLQTGGSTAASVANLGNQATGKSRWGPSRTLNLAGDYNQVMWIGMTREYYNGGTSLRSATGIGDAVNTFNGQWPVFPIGLATNFNGTLNDPGGQQSYYPFPGGRIGTVFDMWWKPSGLSWGDSFPNDASHRQYMSMGDLIVPWVGDATALSTT